MDGMTRRAHSESFGVCLLSCGLLSVLLASGCSDSRISLAEFLAMQERGPEVADAEPSSTTQPAESQPEIDDAQLEQQLGRPRLAPGDVVTVTLTGLEQTSPYAPLPVRVDREGKLSLPGVGSLKVGGLELEEAEKVVHDAYVPKVYTEIVVHLAAMEPNTTKVLVLGAASTPGLVALRQTERNLLFAAVGAGGSSESASGTVTLRRLRQPGKEVKFNLRDPKQLRKALAQEPLEQGDIVTLESAIPNTVFVGGLVNSPRPQSYPPGVPISILQAIAASGGLRTDISPTEGTLIRRMPDGKDVQVKLDLDRLSQGKDPNIALAAGDILWIPHTVLTRIHEWTNQHIFFQAGGTVTANAGYNYNASAIDYANSNAASEGANNAGTGTSASDPFGYFLQSLRQPVIPTPVP